MEEWAVVYHSVSNDHIFSRVDNVDAWKPMYAMCSGDAYAKSPSVHKLREHTHLVRVDKEVESNGVQSNGYIQW